MSKSEEEFSLETQWLASVHSVKKQKNKYKTHTQTCTLAKKKQALRCIHLPRLHTISCGGACDLERRRPSGGQLQRVADYSHRVPAMRHLSAANWANQRDERHVCLLTIHHAINLSPSTAPNPFTTANQSVRRCKPCLQIVP